MLKVISGMVLAVGLMAIGFMARDYTVRTEPVAQAGYYDVSSMIDDSVDHMNQPPKLVKR